MPNRPENLIPPKRRDELKEKLEALGLSRKVLHAAEVELTVRRRELNALLHEFEGKALPVKGKAVAVEFIGGYRSFLDKYHDIPAGNYTVGQTSRYQIQENRPETMTVVSLAPTTQGNVRFYMAVTDELQFASLAEIKAVERQQQPQQA